MTRLHLYGQAYWHSEAFIVGDRRSLELLRDGIDMALADTANGTSLVAGLMTDDGEGFDLVVAARDVASWRLPYTDEPAKDRRTEGDVIDPGSDRAIIDVVRRSTPCQVR